MCLRIDNGGRNVSCSAPVNEVNEVPKENNIYCIYLDSQI